MPVDSKHMDHIRYRAKVQKTRDMIEGGYAAKRHIIRLPAHDEEEWQAWRDGASFLPATERTRDAFVGMVMDPEPQVEHPENFQPILDDISNNGEPFRRVCSRVVGELLETGKVVVLADAPPEDDVFAGSELARTAGNYAALGGRPYAKIYTWENILYWRCENVGGMKRLVELRLMEYDEVQDPDDEFVWETVPRIRVLDVIEGRYRQRVYRQEFEEVVDPKNRNLKTVQVTWVQDGGDIFPKMGKNPPGQIPAIVFGPDTLDPEETKNPPLLDLANLNCDHLQNSASLENTVRNLGCATLFIKAHPPTDENGNVTPIRFGSNQAIIIPDGDAKLLSLGSEGVAGIIDVMERKEKQMVAIGARALMVEHSGQVSTETERIRRAGEHSMLAQLANTVSDGMTHVLEILANWASINGKINCSLNTDFLPAGLQPGELTEWTGSLQQGSISLETFLNRLKERGVVDPEITTDEYRAQLEEDAFAGDFGTGDEDEPPVEDPEEDDPPEEDE